MESEQEVQNESKIKEDLNQIKKKKVWHFLSIIEFLMSKLYSGKKVRCIIYDTETTGLKYKKPSIRINSC